MKSILPFEEHAFTNTPSASQSISQSDKHWQRRSAYRKASRSFPQADGINYLSVVESWLAWKHGAQSRDSQSPAGLHLHACLCAFLLSGAPRCADRSPVIPFVGSFACPRACHTPCPIRLPPCPPAALTAVASTTAVNRLRGQTSCAREGTMLFIA